MFRAVSVCTGTAAFYGMQDLWQLLVGMLSWQGLGMWCGALVRLAVRAGSLGGGMSPFLVPLVSHCFVFCGSSTQPYKALER
jgi:hypothetical protein